MSHEIELHLPEIAPIHPFRCHERLVELEAASNQWSREHLAFALGEGEMDLFLASGYTFWTCLCFPDGETNRVRNMCDLTQYFFALDDEFSRQAPREPDAIGRTFDAILGVLEGAAPSGGLEYVRVLDEIWSRIRIDMSPDQQARYATSVREFLRGFAAEVEARRRDTSFDYEKYLELRRDSVSGRPYFILCEYALGVDLGRELAAQQPLARLSETALEQLILVNDVFSFRKEYFAGDALNAISVVSRSQGVDVQQALERVCAMIHDRTNRFVAERNELLAGELGRRPDVWACADGLGQIMAGNLRWSYLTSRYHGTGHAWNGVTSGKVILTPERTIFVGRE